MLVESIMTSDVLSVSPEASVQEALEITKKHRIRHLPVLVDGKLVGLISDRDLRDAVHQEHSTVEQRMVRDVITCHPLDFVEDAASTIYKNRIGCLPVVSKGRVVGIVSERDILNTLVEMMGVNCPTSRIEVEVPDKPGMLADIADLLRARRLNTSTVLVFPSTTEGFKTLVFRVATMDPRRFIQDIQNAGYRVVQHPSALDDGEV
ncbi:acetoin utilization AcuB family protein [Tumebacillus flagellatus]|uniref:Acetoin utilization protein AcuB n=1 Tax=Tumebacillus flagellatus TaxID=1157490 RepID=A0A074LWN0_9BACL|nr:acetoin utilization AcuB family protein [Tumebacillus flagellatus]KEO85030.1 acetoin utilization protein AcuB [Tumebacillus flagellatus]